MVELLLEVFGDLLAVFAHEHEGEPEYGFALSVCGDGAATDFAVDRSITTRNLPATKLARTAASR